MLFRHLRNWFYRHHPLLRRVPPSFENTKESGQYAERVAAVFLASKGYKILVCNYRSKTGEIDLVCRDADTLIFVEVKSRTQPSVERPASAVTFEKRKKISRTAQNYVREIRAGNFFAHFDIVEVYMPEGEIPQCVHLPHAFTLTLNT